MKVSKECTFKSSVKTQRSPGDKGESSKLKLAGIHEV